MWQNLKDEALQDRVDMRNRALFLFSQDFEVLLDILNNFLFWRGTLATEGQFQLHNAAEEYVQFLMGPPHPDKLDRRYLEQLETLTGETPLDRKMTGESYQGRTKKRGRPRHTEQSE